MDFNIYYFTPYNLDKNLGAAYNEYMKLIPRDRDWACLLDGDTMFLTPDFGTQIHHIVSMYPDTGMFTCMTNRVGIIKQRYQGIMSANGEMGYHKRLANRIQRENYEEVEPINQHCSGLMMLIQKKTWKKVKFTDGLLGVDFKFCDNLIAAGYDIKLMKGVYLMHYYRFLEGRHNKNHLL
jgi:GT2 family glycosyltransferase